MAWRRPGNKPLSEPIMVSLLTYIHVNPYEWVNVRDRNTAVSQWLKLKNEA